MICRRCRELNAQKDPFRTVRRCAFDNPDGVFNSENAHCGTLAELRELTEGAVVEAPSGQKAAIVAWGDVFILQTWSANSSTTDACVLMIDHMLVDPTLGEIENLLSGLPFEPVWPLTWQPRQGETEADEE